jgi:NTP pyrophosphatase (non-canonical NTP hydrolase)
MALASEASGLLELFKWLTEEQSRQLHAADKKGVAADAVAEIVLLALRLGDELGIEIDEAIKRKMAKNAEKYPATAVGEIKAGPPPVAARHTEEPSLAKEKRPPASRTRPHAEVEANVRRAAPAEPVQRSPALRDTRRHSQAPSPRQTHNVGRGAQLPTASPPPPVETESVPPASGPDRYAKLDPDAAKSFLKSLSRRLEGVESDEPLWRELRDELETLKRTLHSATPKRAWIGESLKTIQGMLELAARLTLGDEIKAKDYIALVERILQA